MSTTEPTLESVRPTPIPADVAPTRPANPTPAAPAELAIAPHAARPAYHRSLAPDIARGFMLLFIALANVSFYIWTADPTPGIADRITAFIGAVAIEGRTYPMFAFLFGYGMVQFYNSRRNRGLPDKAVRHMLWRRHWGMVVFGLVHFMLLFVGDILAPYGLCGLIAMAIWFRRRDKTTFVWFWILMGLMLLSAISMAIATMFVPELRTGGNTALAGGFTELVANPDYWGAMGTKLLFLIAIPSQVLFAPLIPMMMLGWLAARRGILENPAQHRKLLTRVAIIGISLAWLTAIPGALMANGLDLGFIGELGISLSGILGTAGGLGYIALFGLLAARWQDAPPAAMRVVASVGQRSLSSYLLQSLIFAPLLCGWGLGLGEHIGRFAAALIAIAVWGVSVAMCAWLDRRGARGPAEVVLRRFTYGKNN